MWIVKAALPLVLCAVASADELDEARMLLASPQAKVRLAAIKKLAEIDSKGAIDALSTAVQRSASELDALGKRLDKNDREWEKAFDLVLELEDRGKDGTEPHRQAQFRQGQLEREWEQLNTEAQLHLDVLHEAGLALSGFRSEEAVAALEKGARTHPHALVRILYIGALGHTGRASSLETLTELVRSDKDPRARAQAVRGLIAWAPKGWEIAVAAARDPCWAVRRGAIEALAHAPLATAARELVEAAGRESGELRLTALSYLQQITKTRAGDSYEAWRAWWDQHGASIRDGTYAAPEEAPSPPPGRRTFARFFRIPIESTHVVFAIDYSGSMSDRLRLDSARSNAILREHALPQTRLGYAKAELIGAIRELPEGALFNVVAYSDTASFLFESPAPASAAVREKAIRWVVEARTGTMTNIYAALNKSFRDYLDASGGAARFQTLPDTIVFLTDGNATRGRFRTADALRKLVRLWNQPLDVVVHCIGIGDDQDQELLEGLAQETGGYYVDIRKVGDDLDPRNRPLPAR
jgi:HEAT repeat protein